MIGVLFSLLPFFFWGISDYVSSRMSKKFHPGAINFFSSFLIGVVTISFCLLFGLPEFSLDIFKNFVLSSIFLTGGYVSLLLAFKNGKTGIIAPIANAYALVTLLFAVLFLKVETNSIQILAVLIIILGVFSLSYKKTNEKKFKIDRSVFIALASMTLYGIGFALFDVAATQEWYQNTILFQLSSFLVGIILGLVWMKANTWRYTSVVFVYRIGYTGVVAFAIGSVGIFIALENVNNVAVPASIAAASPLVTVFIARHYDKEHLLFRQYISAVVIVSGIAILGISS
jgi:drug/metabolite transporter (DMT)-like permease